MWEAVERSRNQFDTEYLEKIAELVDKLGAAGIYTLIDMHQDAFARLSCGEGFPDFYAKQAAEKPYCINRFIDWFLSPLYDSLGFCQNMDSFGYSQDENGNPEITDCISKPFWKYYLTQQSIDGFEAFYKNDFDLQTKFLKYWDVVSRKFANNPFVVGYDPLNEPFFGNPFRDPLNAMPGYFDKHVLEPLFTLVNEQYETNDPTYINWFEPVQEPDVLGVLGGLVFHVGYEKPPGGEINSNHHVLNDHLYCC